MPLYAGTEGFDCPIYISRHAKYMILPLVDIWTWTKTLILVLNDIPCILESKQWFIIDALIWPNLGISVYIIIRQSNNDPNPTKMITDRHFHPRDKDLVKKFRETILRNDDYILTSYILYQSTFLAPSVTKGHLKVSNISQDMVRYMNVCH